MALWQKRNSYDGYKNLAFTIIAQSLTDYKQALIYKDWGNIYKCEAFIKSEWFETLSLSGITIPPEKLIDKMRIKFLGNLDVLKKDDCKE